MPHAGSSITRIVGAPKRFTKGCRTYVGYEANVVSEIEKALPLQTENVPGTVTTRENVTLLAPLVPDRKSMVGGVYQSGQYLSEFALFRGARPFTLAVSKLSGEDPAEVIGEAWFGGYLLNPFGHFIVESIARLLDERIISSHLPIVFMVPRRPVVKRDFRLAKFMVEIFGLLGIEASRIKLCTSSMLVATMHSIAPFLIARGKFNVAAIPVLKSCARVDSDGPARIYLSRLKVRSRRGISGEEKVEDLMAARGFAIVHPQEHSVAQQIAMLSAADTIVGIEGSALHTLMFARGRKKVIVLSHDAPTATYTMLDESFDGDTFYLRNGSAENEGSTRGDWSISSKLVDSLDTMIE
jgi:hypothetical protein